jgi:hypothetical protein
MRSSLYSFPRRDRIFGTLFYGLERYKKLYREKQEDTIDPTAINPAQRQLFGYS